jgi:hypothetical protein
MKNIIKFFGVIVVIMLLLSSYSSKSTELEEFDSGQVQKKARKVWCQVLGDRQGCRNDNNRTCDDTVFCN